MKKKYTVTVKMLEQRFSASTTSPSEAWEMIRAIIKCDPINFPEQEKALDGWLETLMDEYDDVTGNYVFELKKEEVEEDA